MREHNANAAKVAVFLNAHPMVESVLWPGLDTHEGHDIAKKQMSGYGGMISFTVKGGDEKARQVVSGSKIISHATSLGGVESTWERRRSTEGPESQTPGNLIRISVGLEHADDIIEDIDRSLK